MKTIEEKNRMIAEFMGGTYVHETNTSFAHVKISGYIKGSFLLHELSYHSSWDWLMPVVEQIESIEDENRCAKYNFNSVQCFVDIVDNNTSEEIVKTDCNNKFDSTYKAVCEFIEWYNENK